MRMGHASPRKSIIPSVPNDKVVHGINGKIHIHLCVLDTCMCVAVYKRPQREGVIYMGGSRVAPIIFRCRSVDLIQSSDLYNI